MVQFQKASKASAFGRMALIGPAGGGKTYSALRIAQVLAGDKRTAVIDTEHGSASKYADEFDFDTVLLEVFSPEKYMEAMKAAEQSGQYGCLIIDSLSHAWAGKGGLLEYVDAEAQRSQSKNSFAAWRKATPKHHALVESMLALRMHLIVTMRTKTEWVVEKDSRGKSVPRKVGLQPVQRDGLEYEFDVVADMAEARMIIGKTRCPGLFGQLYENPGQEVGELFMAWLTGEGEPQPNSNGPSSGAPSGSAGAGSPPPQPGGNGNSGSDKRTAYLNRINRMAAEAGIEPPQWQLMVKAEIAQVFGKSSAGELDEGEALVIGKRLKAKYVVQDDIDPCDACQGQGATGPRNRRNVCTKCSGVGYAEAPATPPAAAGDEEPGKGEQWQKLNKKLRAMKPRQIRGTAAWSKMLHGFACQKFGPKGKSLKNLTGSELAELVTFIEEQKQEAAA